MTNQKRIFLACASVLFGMGLGGVAFMMGLRTKKPGYQSPYKPGATPPSVPDPSPEPLVTLPKPSPGTTNAEAPSYTYYRIVDGTGGPVLRPETVGLPSGAKTDEDKIRLAIQAMVEGESPPLPKGTRLLRLQRTGETVLFDLSKEFKTNFAGSDRSERLVINALTATAAQLEGAKKLQIFVDGEAVETLGGDQSLLEPLTIPHS